VQAGLARTTGPAPDRMQERAGSDPSIADEQDLRKDAPRRAPIGATVGASRRPVSSCDRVQCDQSRFNSAGCHAFHPLSNGRTIVAREDRLRGKAACF
ncbi:MAG: hypothetical protein LC777_04655, partial [Actinobacteria bacterium]|nr:hypothetical protein [Actinomycetota bacterium]